MIGPYWMVAINIILSVVLIAGILVYRYIFPKRNINFLVLLILISLLPLVSLLRAGSYESGDLSTHAMLSISFFESLTNGDLIPVWGGEMNMGYGYPAFHFTYSLPYYLISFFHFLGFSFVISAKLLIAFSFTLSGIFMYLFLKEHVKEIAAFTGGLFYLFAPYHLIDMHFRVDVGEMLAFVFLPLCLLSATSFIKSRQIKWLIIEIFSFAFLILSHPAIAFAGFGVLIIYIGTMILTKVNKKDLIISQIFCLFLSVLLTAFYWLPIFQNIKFTSTHTFVHSVSFLNIKELLFSHWRLGFLFQGPQGQLAFIIGYAQILVIILALILLVKKRFPKDQNHLLISSLIITIVCIFMTLNISTPVWESVPFLKSFQFSYRLLGILMLSTAIIAAVLANNLSKKWIIILICALAIFSTILNWGNRKNIPDINDEYLRQQIPHTNTNGAGLGQAATIWSDPKNTWASKTPEKNIEIIEGKAEITQISRENNYHLYLINAASPVKIKENTLYFPGWKFFINNKPAQIFILSNTEPKGVMSFPLPAGLHKIEFIFEDTLAHTMGKTISLVSLITLLAGLVILKQRKS